jgi:hypothetical protein
MCSLPNFCLDEALPGSARLVLLLMVRYSWLDRMDAVF